MKKTTTLYALAAATLCASMAWIGQDAQEAAAPSPKALARMAPGPMHAKLEPLVGTWHIEGKWRMSPDAAWQEFEADVEREWVLGDRFLRETVSSEMMGQPFEGMGLIGYDNTREEFTMVWVENMSTGTHVSTGRMDGNVITFEGENSNAMTGEERAWGKSVLDLGGESHTFKGYMKDSSGREFQNMEMVETKK